MRLERPASREQTLGPSGAEKGVGFSDNAVESHSGVFS